MFTEKTVDQLYIFSAVTTLVSVIFVTVYHWSKKEITPLITSPGVPDDPSSNAVVKTDEETDEKRRKNYEGSTKKVPRKTSEQPRKMPRLADVIHDSLCGQTHITYDLQTIKRLREKQTHKKWLQIKKSVLNRSVDWPDRERESSKDKIHAVRYNKMKKTRKGDFRRSNSSLVGLDSSLTRLSSDSEASSMEALHKVVAKRDLREALKSSAPAITLHRAKPSSSKSVDTLDPHEIEDDGLVQSPMPINIQRRVQIQDEKSAWSAEERALEARVRQEQLEAIMKVMRDNDKANDDECRQTINEQIKMYAL